MTNRISVLGYGAISPSTKTGQGLCIVFAIIGIPVTILAFQAVGELISRGITVAIKTIEKRCFRQDPTNVEAKCTAVTFALMLIMLLCGSVMQVYLEEWSFLVAVYYWLITFTTIGYGDYITGKKTSFLGRCVFSCLVYTWTVRVFQRFERHSVLYFKKTTMPKSLFLLHWRPRNGGYKQKLTGL